MATTPLSVDILEDAAAEALKGALEAARSADSNRYEHDAASAHAQRATAWCKVHEAILAELGRRPTSTGPQDA